jgi:hypothetical protein
MNVLSKIHEAVMTSNDLTPEEVDEIAMNVINQFSWVIPTEEVLEKFRDKMIVEMGAGRGYWAKQYDKIAKSVRCYDLYPQFNVFHPVEQFGPHHLKHHNEDWTLFICSPQYRSDMVLECLRYFNGNKFYYAGDTNFSMNLPSISQELKTNWRQVCEIDLPNWPNSNNKFLEFERRE